MKEIVIKIPDYLHERICKVKDFVNESYYMSQLDRADMYEAIKNGTVLPKGHERLIEDKVDSWLELEYDGREIKDIEDFNNISTIVEADKENENDV